MAVARPPRKSDSSTDIPRATRMATLLIHWGRKSRILVRARLRWRDVSVPSRSKQLARNCLDPPLRSVRRWQARAMRAEKAARGARHDALGASLLLVHLREVVDVTGHLGGYNFQWAWSSGYVAGVALGGKEDDA